MTRPRLTLVKTDARKQYQLRRGTGHGKLLLCRPRFAGDVVHWVPWYSVDTESVHILPSEESAARSAAIYGGEPEPL